MSIQELYDLEWDLQDVVMLPEKYLNEPVHIAFEQMDMFEDEKSLKYIMSKHGKLLHWHASKCYPVFHFDFYCKCFNVDLEKDVNPFS